MSSNPYQPAPEVADDPEPNPEPDTGPPAYAKFAAIILVANGVMIAFTVAPMVGTFVILIGVLFLLVGRNPGG